MSSMGPSWRTWLVVVVVVVVVLVTRGEAQGQDDSPPQPEVANLYTTRVEVTRITDQNITLVDYMQYDYHGPENKVAIKIPSKYTFTRYILNWNTGQMLKFKLPKNGEGERECLVRFVEEGVTLFPVLSGSGRNLSSDHIPSPGVILGVLNWTDTHYKGQYGQRGMPSERWDWCGLKQYEQDAATPNVSMATYWSASSWKMPVPEWQIHVSFPLGYEVVIQASDPPTPDMTKPLVHNIMYYRPDEVDAEAFLLPSEVYCPGMLPEGGHDFPDFSKDRLFTFSLEVKLPDTNAVSWADGWYDFEKQLYRIDHDVSSTPRETITTSEILDFNDGLSFTIPWGFGPGECWVSLINDTRTDWSDITGLGHLWADSPNAFFGLDTTNYTYYGLGVIRGLTGEEWRGQRTDWPPNTVDETTLTLWQWTFTHGNVSTVTSMGEVVYLERHIPIGLKVTAHHDINTNEGLFAKGSSYVYQLYNFDLETDVKEDLYSDAGVFDTYQCYSANWRDHLKFKLDVSSWVDVVETPLFTSVWFREYWQKLLAEKGTVSPLRITRVKTIWEDNGLTWVEFVLLYRHPAIGDLNTDLFQHMTTGVQARQFISQAIDNGEVFFDGTRADNGEAFRLVAVAGSLSIVTDPDCFSTTTSNPHSTTPHSTPPVISTTTTPGGNQGTTTTPSSNSVTTTPSTTTSTTPPTIPINNNKPYSSGDLAGLGIGMLLTGLAFGAFATFLVVIKQCHYAVMSCCR
ncbi:hypothetical protein Pcinc_013872 [Petrolisthes cinctipes]|uniref:LolA-like domain-containing protein n=1 Tax=Petrolisthes cinctipes TaxID=88211 RepID=A0AAE1FYY0_PETCI|nr:hypothetical protein Pcinc_013872 [Petrolisthes cinctipes]